MTLNDRINGMLSLPDGRAVLLGIGVSNRPLALMLAGRGLGKRLIIRDAKSADAIGDFTRRIPGATVIAGTDPCSGLCDREDMSRTVIFRSPGIRPDSGDLAECVRRGALLTSEMEWFCDSTPARIFAVTGSDGKTTTTTLTHLLVSGSGRRAFVGGNIGTPLLDRVGEMTASDTAVLELSSFQLQTMKGPAHRAAITNITPNHLNWHVDMEEYTKAKYNVFGDRTELLVVNAKNPLSAAAAGLFPGRVSFFTAHAQPGDSFESLTGGRENCDLYCLSDGKIIRTDGKSTEEILDAGLLILPGIHNIENYMTAIALTRGYSDRETVLKTASTFRGVAHRFEFVRELRGVRYYNSSIDSTPTRTAAALSNLSCRQTVICGGRDKHLPWDPLVEALFARASTVVLTGESAGAIEAAIAREAGRRADGGASLRVIREDDFAAAVSAASAAAKPGEAVVLSPACTSFDRFSNFEERGNLYKELVMKL